MDPILSLQADLPWAILEAPIGGSLVVQRHLIRGIWKKYMMSDVFRAHQGGTSQDAPQSKTPPYTTSTPTITIQQVGVDLAYCARSAPPLVE